MTLLNPKQILQTTPQSWVGESHFLNISSPELPGNYTAVGAGTSYTLFGGAAIPAGFVRFTTSTATGRSLWSTPPSFMLGSGQINAEIDFRIPVLSFPGDSYGCLMGLGGTYVAGTDEMSNGAYIYVDQTAIYPATKRTGQSILYGQFGTLPNTSLNNIKIQLSGNNARFIYNDNELIDLSNVPTDAIALFIHQLKIPGNTGTADIYLDIDYARLELIN